MKTIFLSICNRLMATAITHCINHSGCFQVHPIAPNCPGIAKKCAAASADILLMETACSPGATLDECLNEVRALRSLRPQCRTILLCDENSSPEIARKVAMAKKDGMIDEFVYSSVSESYLTALLHAI